MLYDKRWDEKKVETKPVQPSLVGLIAWLKKQPRDTEYDYCNPFGCVVGRYLQSARPNNAVLDSFEINELFGFGANSIFQDMPWTFGAALDRARKFTATQGA